MHIGIIGAGAIANFLLEEINNRNEDHLKISSVYVRNKEKYQALEEKFNVTLYTDFDAFLETNIDIVVEAANVEAVKTLLPKTVKKKDVVVISIGAFVNEKFLTEITESASENRHVVHLPSGAIGGLDLLQNANALETVKRVALTTRKPAHSLGEGSLETAKVIFDGQAKDAIRKFPKNINVSIVLSLAGLGVENTTVRLVADPHIEKNIHQIEWEGDFGEASFTVKNNPLPSNPKTSYLAAMSILGTLQRLHRTVKIGG